MNKIIFSVICLSFFLSGCGRKEKVETPIESQQEIINESVLEPVVTSPQISNPAETVAPEAASPATLLQEAMIPETPTPEDIQKALKNAGLYEGDVDGKLGPKSKKAIEDFQAKSDLTVDGKVGPKTWSKLKEYLNAPAETAAEMPSPKQ
ncbi:MAG: peptidoglycan-binding domain-containing protein [Candidatus Omnitrophica bacterium]|nr:peptidoglycan-binding domain-containing protein [Candidatus Omnitrophota bacterium]